MIYTDFFKNKNILITGAGGGLGTAFAKKFRELGANLILVDIKVCDYVCDFTNDEEILKTTSLIKRKYKKIDVLINNAGVGFYKSISEVTSEEMLTSIKVNVWAPFLLMKELLPLIKRSDLKSIVNIGSGCGRKPLPRRVDYNLTKFALRGLSLSSFEDLKEEEVHVIYLELGSAFTSFGPLGFEGRIKRCKEEGKCYLMPDEVANFVAENLQTNACVPEWSLYPKDN